MISIMAIITVLCFSKIFDSFDETYIFRGSLIISSEILYQCLELSNVCSLFYSQKSLTHFYHSYIEILSSVLIIK
jgi:hypothetical protein